MTFATEQDYAECARLLKKHGTSYNFSAALFSADIRRKTAAVYGFVRVPDEWVDNAGDTTIGIQQQKLQNYRKEFLLGLDGVRPEEPVLRAFCDVARESSIETSACLEFLDAMEMDLTCSRYETYADLQQYMSGSASAVGVMMCGVIGISDSEQLRGARVLGEAMQLTNFIRDVSEDIDRGRIYLPLEHLQQFGVTTDQVVAKEFNNNFRSLIQFEIDLARSLYSDSDRAISQLTGANKRAVMMARVLYSRILDRVEAQGCNVFLGRARTSRLQKLAAAIPVLLSR